MARVLKMDEILAFPDGTEAWEEWIAGTDTRRVLIFQSVSRDRFRVRDAEQGFTSTTRTDTTEFRYWDAKPTFDERESTPWE